MSGAGACVACGRPLRPGATFCTFCGGRTGGTQVKEVGVEAALAAADTAAAPNAGETAVQAQAEESIVDGSEAVAQAAVSIDEPGGHPVVAAVSPQGWLRRSSERALGMPLWAKVAVTAVVVVIVGLAVGLGTYFGTRPDGAVKESVASPVTTTAAAAPGAADAAAKSAYEWQYGQAVDFGGLIITVEAPQTKNGDTSTVWSVLITIRNERSDSVSYGGSDFGLVDAKGGFLFEADYLFSSEPELQLQVIADLGPGEEVSGYVYFLAASALAPVQVKYDPYHNPAESKDWLAFWGDSPRSDIVERAPEAGKAASTAGGPGASVVAVVTTTSASTTTTAPVTTTIPAPTTAGDWVPGQPPADWSRFAGGGAEMYLPSTYVGTDPETALPAVLDYLRGLGSEYTSWVQEFEGMDLATMPIFALDASQADSGSVDNVNVRIDTAAAGEVVAIDELISAMVDAVETLGARVVSSGQVLLNGVVTARFVVESEIGGTEVSQMTFGLVDSYGFWVITFTTTRERFPAIEAMFDQSASTFRTSL